LTLRLSETDPHDSLFTRVLIKEADAPIAPGSRPSARHSSIGPVVMNERPAF